MIEQLKGQMSIVDCFGPDIWSGKTCPEPLAQTKAKTSEPSSKKQRKSSAKMPLYLDLRGGKWSPSGCIMGDGWSIAWRVHDAQFWGVPQRRKRIALVADFGGESAPEILFERESLCGDIEESREEGQEAPRTVRGDIEETISFQERAGCDGGARESSYSMSEQEPCQHSIINRCYSIDEKMGQTYIHGEQGNTLGARDYKQPQAVVCGEGGQSRSQRVKPDFF